MSSLIDIDPKLSDAAKANVHGVSAKIPIPIEEVPENLRGKSTFSQADIDTLSNLISQNIKSDVVAQLVPKRAVPVKDFSSLTQDSIYDPDVFMEAKSFMSGDPLRVVLKDTNYEPRWVSKNSQRLGYMKAIGFTYAVAEDIQGNLDVDLEIDANGHFSFHDVVLMRVPKSTYYPALKAAHERAQNVVSAQKAQRNGAVEAANFMRTEKDDSGNSVAGDFSEATGSGKMEFYHPKL